MLKKYAVFLCCLIALSVAIIGCGGGGGGETTGNPVGPALTPGATANLSGTVLFDNNPTPFAAVFLIKSEKAHTVGMAQLPSLKGSLLSQQIIGDGAWSTTTDSEGVYSFNSIPVGQYTLIAKSDETHQFVQTGVLLGQVTTINPQLTPTGKITGQVTLATGGTPQGIGGAFVCISGTSYIAFSDAAGNFTINNVPSNTLNNGVAYEILVSSTNGTAAPRTGVTVSPGATSNIGTIALTAPSQAGYAVLSGALVAGKNVSSLAGLLVVLTHQTSNSMFGAITDATGKFQFRVMETGNFLVLCNEADYSFTPTPLTVSVTSLVNQTITLSPITADATQVQNTGSIAGMVTLAGSPVAGAVVHASGTSLVGVSNAAGRFVIEKVPANTSATPYTLELSASMGTATAKAGIVVNVGQATDAGIFVITVPTNGYKTITGQLVAVAPVNPTALANRLVQLTAPDGKVIAAFSNSTGAFSFITTQTGNHTATVIDRDFIYNQRTQNINVGLLDNNSLALPAINASALDATGDIIGQVTSAGSPVSGAVVNVVGTPFLGVSDSDGNFMIGRIPANTSASPYTLEVNSNLGTAPAKTTVVVNVGQATDAGIFAITLPTAGYKTITGQLVAVSPVNTTALANRLVQLTAPDGKVIADYSNSTGAFSLITTQTGTHTLTVIDNSFDYVPRTQSINVGALDNADLALTTINVSQSNLNVSVSGTITWPTPPGTWVFTDGEVILSGTSFIERRIVGAAPASYRFDNVPPGNYTLSVNPIRNGYQGSISFAVSAGVDVTGQSLTPSFIAPVIMVIADPVETMSIGAMNLGTDPAAIEVLADNQPLPIIALAGNMCDVDISGLTPGSHTVQIVKTIAEGKLAGDKAIFAKPISPPDNASATITTDKTATVAWINSPFAQAVEVELVGSDKKLVYGNSCEFTNLQPDTDYIVRIRSVYNNQFSWNAPDVSFRTEATGLGNIESIALSGTAGQNVFGFEVCSNTAYIAIQNVIGSPITLLAYQNMTSPPVSLNVETGSNCFPRYCSMAVNADGVFLTHTDINGNIALQQFSSTLGFIASRSLTVDYEFVSPSMAAVRSFNDRVFLVTRDDTSVEVIELAGLDIVASTTVFASNALAVKSADLAHDPVTNTLYLANFGPGELGGIIEIRAFNDMSLNISNPPIIGVLEEIAGAELTVIGACNNLIFCAEYSSDFGITSKFVDARSGFVHDIYNSTSFDGDRQNRIWIDYNTEVMSNNVFARLDNGLSMQQTLADYVYDVSYNLNRIRLDRVTGMMNMLYRNFNDDNLMIYRYNSNY